MTSDEVNETIREGIDNMKLHQLIILWIALTIPGLLATIGMVILCGLALKWVGVL